MEASAPAARATVATYDNYLEAERAVDYLSDNDFRSSGRPSSAPGLRPSSRSPAG